jgi:hypothetical protein
MLGKIIEQSDLDVVDNSGKVTPIMYAFKYCKSIPDESAKKLIFGSNLFKKDVFGNTPAMLAVSNEVLLSEKVWNVLITSSNVLEVNNRKQSILLCALQNNKDLPASVYTLLVERSDLNFKDFYGQTPLMKFLHSEIESEVILNLLIEKSDLNVKGIDGDLALIDALALYGKKRIPEKYLQKMIQKSDCSIHNIMGLSPLGFAMILLGSGGDKISKDTWIMLANKTDFSKEDHPWNNPFLIALVRMQKLPEELWGKFVKMNCFNIDEKFELLGGKTIAQYIRGNKELMEISVLKDYVDNSLPFFEKIKNDVGFHKDKKKI